MTAASVYTGRRCGGGRRGKPGSASCLPELLWDEAMEREPQASGCQPQLLPVTLGSRPIPALSGPLLTTELDDKELLSALTSDRSKTDVGQMLLYY